MKFVGKQFKHSNAIALSFRKSTSHEAYKVAELAEEICHETLDLKFQDVFLSSAQDVTTSTVAKTLEVDKIDCDVFQGDKVGASDVGELFHTANKA